MMDGESIDQRPVCDERVNGSAPAGMPQSALGHAPWLIPPEASRGRTFSGRMKSSLRQQVMRSAGHLAAGLHAVAGDRPAHRVGILTYHRTAPQTAGVRPPTHNVNPQRFREQIAGLVRLGYQFRPLSAILNPGLGSESHVDRTVVVTFDDGFETVYTQAYAVLREYGIPFTLFVNTAYLDRNDPFPFDTWGREFSDRVSPASYRPLTGLQCHAMLDEGLMELGAHTHTHADFRSRPEFLRQDLSECVRILREDFGIEKPTFAFPFGSRKEGFASDELIDAARQTGVCCALSTECGPVDPKSDPFLWGRYNVFPWDTSATLAAKLAGWYDWLPHGWRRILGRDR